jgi:hypothetical protein
MKYFEQTDDNGQSKAISKLEFVKNEMSEYISSIIVEKQTNDMRKKPLSIQWNTRIYNKLESVLLKAERPIPNGDALLITAEQFYEYYNEYCDLCCWIEDRLFISYNKTKPEFCAYCAITSEAFENIKINGDYHQTEALNDIDTRIANSILMSAEKSELKSVPAEFRLTAKSGLGHKIQTTNNKEPVVVLPVTENSFTPLSELMPPKMPKQIKGKTDEE